MIRKSARTNYASVFSFLFIVTTWLIWYQTQGLAAILSNWKENWEIAVTMIFGSMVAGGTSMGGGAVAFPVMTKVLHISPYQAKLFSLAIQSIGMTSASIMILALKIRVNWKLIGWVSLGGLIGIFVGILWIFPMMNATSLKIIFSSMVGVFGVVLWIQRKNNQQKPVIHDLVLNVPEKLIFLVTGITGGVISGLVGNGIDIVSFTVLVLLFGFCEKEATPNTVIMMAINAVVGFLIHYVIVGDFTVPVTSFWAAAVPIVVVGAPIGAVLCKLISPLQLVRVLIVLIGLEVSFTLLLIEQNLVNMLTFLGASVFFWLFFRVLNRSRKRREQHRRTTSKKAA